MPNKNKIYLETIILPELSGKRLDQALSILFPEHSRARIQSWIKNNFVKIDDIIVNKNNFKVTANQKVEVNAEITAQNATYEAQEIKLDIIYEDKDIIVINKPAGLVVHPGAGNTDKTLLNALLFHAPELKNIPRAGIIHRLDKDTSGLLVIAKTLAAHTKLVSDLQKRLVKREYEAVIYGVLTAGGIVDAPIGRHQLKRKLMTVTESGKTAITHYRIIERFSAFTHIRVILETGRTHQIRVHMAHIHHPILGDPVYGRLKLPKNASAELIAALRSFKRQALHAKRLSFNNPRTGKLMEFEAILPKDMKSLIKIIQSGK
jgi:23S rRNA pseudouridine1911/1915/1917 synthase